MNKFDNNPIMDEVYAVRHEISSRFGNDPKRYIASILEMKRRASERVAHLFKLYASHAPKSLSSHCCVA